MDRLAPEALDRITADNQRLRERVAALEEELTRSRDARAAVDAPANREHHAADESTHKQNVELEQIYATVPVGLAFLDAELRYRRLNDSLAAINGCSVAEHIGRPVREVLPAVADVLEPVLRRVLATGEPVINQEITGATRAEPDRERVWRASYYPVRNGSLSGIHAVVEEITERKRVEETLRRERAILHSVLEQLPCGAILAEVPSGKVILGNRQAGVIWRRDTLTAENLADYGEYKGYHADGRSYEGHEWPLARVIATGEAVRGEEIVFERGDGVRGVMGVSAAPVRGEGGAFVAGVALFDDITARKEAEAALRRANEDLARVNRLLEQTHAALFAWRPGGQGITHWNHGAEEMYGYTREEALGRVSHELLRTEQPASAAEFEDRLARGGRWEGELVHRARDGRRVVVESRQVVVTGVDGQAVVLEANRDITLRRRAEDELRHSEAQFRAVFEVAGVGIAQADPHTRRLVRVNAKMSEITGYAEAELLAMTVDELNHAEDRDADAEGFRHLLDNGPFYLIEKRYRRKDGSSLWVRVNATLVRDDAGRPLRTVAVIEDITERRRAERDTQESEARFRMLAESVPQLIWTCLPDGSCDYLSGQWVEYTGIAAEEQLGYGWLERLHPDDREPALRAWQTATAQDGEYDVEFRIQRKDGLYRWFKTRARAQRDREGGIVRWFGTNTDIEDQKATEEALRRANEELTRSNQMLEQFAYVASHDLQEPLRTVNGFVELLGRRYRGQLDEQADEYIQFAVDGARRMQRLIEDLLRFSRAGNRDRPLAPVDLGQTLREVTAGLRASIEETGATITSDPLPTVHGDDGQLAQLLQNLLGNALKYRQPEAAPQVHVRVERRGREWLFAVRDNGTGFDQQHADRVFILFQRLHRGGQYAGTGIGLAICQKIVERHGGRIWAKSAVGEGATFFFTLPMDRNSRGH